MSCNNCGGDYVVGEGGRLECNRCGNIAGDISLLLTKKPFEDTNQYARPDDEAQEEHVSSPQENIRELV